MVALIPVGIILIFATLFLFAAGTPKTSHVNYTVDDVEDKIKVIEGKLYRLEQEVK